MLINSIYKAFSGIIIFLVINFPPFPYRSNKMVIGPVAQLDRATVFKLT